jgi:hypothetical protein
MEMEVVEKKERDANEGCTRRGGKTGKKKRDKLHTSS